MKSYERRTKVAKALQREIASFIQQGGVKDDRLDKFISIVEVDINPALSSAKVLYSVMNEITNDGMDHAGTKAALNEHSGYIRGIVARKLNLKYAPKLIFIESTALSEAVDMVDLINRTVAADQSSHEDAGE